MDSYFLWDCEKDVEIQGNFKYNVALSVICVKNGIDDSEYENEKYSEDKCVIRMVTR